MPWAALGWFMSLTVLAVRKGGWRYPALFAIVVALVGGVNATSILLVGLAPLLWLLYAAFITKEAPGRAVLKAALRIGLLSLGTSLWWIAGLWAEGAYGINILKYTETLPTVSVTSLASEVIRGLGYWYFYGQDKLQPWTLGLPRLHPVALADRREFRRAGHLLPVRHVGPLALPGVRHRPRRPRRGGRRRRLPLHQPHPARKPDQDGRLGFDGRSGHALVQPDRAGGDPRAGAAVGSRDLRHPPVGALGRAGRPGALGRPPGRQPPAVVGRDPGGLQPGSALRPAQLHHRRRALSRCAEPRHPGARDPRRGLRLLHLGRRSRPGLARAHDPLLPDPGGPTPRRAGHRQPPAGPRRVDPRRTVRALDARSHRPAPLGRRHPLRVRCAVRALRRRPPSAAVAPAAGRPGPLRPDHLRPAHPLQADQVPADRRDPARHTHRCGHSPTGRRVRRARRAEHRADRDAAGAPGGRRRRPGTGQRGRSRSPGRQPHRLLLGQCGRFAREPVLTEEPTGPRRRPGAHRQQRQSSSRPGAR